MDRQQSQLLTPQAVDRKRLTWLIVNGCFHNRNCFTCQFRSQYRHTGRAVFTERDVDPAPGDARAVFHANSIAIGDYGPNCHETPHEGPFYGGWRTGEFYKHSPPYQIPYVVMLPSEVDSLLVPVACSSSHIGFCALRYEPIWASLGEAAGLATAMVLKRNTVE